AERSDKDVKIEATTNRKKALEGADAVVCTILTAGVKVWRYDIEIPKRYGVDINVGDTRGPAGIFRFLRTVPTMLDICRDIEKYCPKAIFLNYTNPMAMLCRAMQKETDVLATGLCHSVQHTSNMLADWAGADRKKDRIDYLCAGINHLAWYLRFEINGEDAYPRIRKAVSRKKIYDKEPVRNEMFKHLDYYVTESSGHNSEYNPWFRKRQDLIEKYCLHGTNWNPGEYAYILKQYRQREKTWRKDMERLVEESKEMSLDRGVEYAANIISAYTGGDPYEFNGNVPNRNLVTNLPEDACVEIPVLVNTRGLSPMYVGPLPQQLVPLTGLSVAVEELAVEGGLRGDPRLIFQAILHDPLTSAVLSMDEIKRMTQSMFNKNKDYLPQFKSVKI
ncbi:MAG: alpha-glucosidase/alpha-galactosidase, partial [Candidatus Sumerlaeota bacterium]